MHIYYLSYGICSGPDPGNHTQCQWKKFSSEKKTNLLKVTALGKSKVGLEFRALNSTGADCGQQRVGLWGFSNRTNFLMGRDQFAKG